MYFEYDETEILYLRNKDKKFAEIIEQIGFIKRETDADLFSLLIHPSLVSRFLQKHRQQSGRG